jgi:hypothetical protein
MKHIKISSEWGKVAIEKDDVISHIKRHDDFANNPIMRIETVFKNVNIHNVRAYLSD